MWGGNPSRGSSGQHERGKAWRVLETRLPRSVISQHLLRQSAPITPTAQSVPTGLTSRPVLDHDIECQCHGNRRIECLAQLARSAAPQQLALPRDAQIPDGNFVALDLDGRKYRIRKSDLMSVPYFGALLGGNWAGIDLLPDGSLPIDTDPEIWPILFTYIKRPSIYP